MLQKLLNWTGGVDVVYTKIISHNFTIDYVNNNVKNHS